MLLQLNAREAQNMVTYARLNVIVDTEEVKIPNAMMASGTHLFLSFAKVSSEKESMIYGYFETV